MTDRGDSRRADGQVLVAIKPADLIKRHSQGLCSHGPKIVGSEPLPAGLCCKIQRGFIDQSGRLETHPGPPVQSNPGTDKYRLALFIQAPVALVQRIAGRIRGQNAPPVRTIKDEMARGLADHPSMSGFQACFEEEILRKRQVSRRRESRNDGVGWSYGHNTTSAGSCPTGRMDRGPTAGDGGRSEPAGCFGISPTRGVVRFP
jgi:hypothetical protein